MGKLYNCSICHAPVMELEGQFEYLPAYLPGLDDATRSLAGQVHTSCLVTAPAGADWARAKVHYYQTVQEHEQVSAQEGWTVLVHRRLREVIGIHESGITATMEKSDARWRACPGGGLLKRESESNIEFDNADFVASAHEQLLSQKKLPLSAVVDELGLRDKLYWPDVLDSGRYELSRELRRYWTRTNISSRVHYDKFVPDVVLAAFPRV